jgi:hypothetical protein
MKRIIEIIGMVGGLLSMQTVVHNPGSEFSMMANPNGVWQYGYSLSTSLAADQFRLDQFAAMADDIGFWHPAKSEGTGPGYYPYVAFKTTGNSASTSVFSSSWALRPGEVAMEGSNSGQYSLVRFVAPEAGVYRITTRFSGIHYRLSSTDVHVLHNSKPLFDAEIDGYGGDPNFHVIEGGNPVATWSGSVTMAAGDTITFAVGFGKNKSYYNDTTGLIATITLATEGR